MGFEVGGGSLIMKKKYIQPETEPITIRQERILGVISQVEGNDVTGGGTNTPGMGGGGGGNTPPAPGAKSFAWEWEYDEK